MQKKYLRWVRAAQFSLCIFLFSTFQENANAGVFELPVLTKEQTESVFSALASSSVFRSLEPASHPKLFGFWLNVRANVTDSSELNKVLGTSATAVPFGAIQGGFNGPYGLGLELGFLPSPKVSGTQLSSFGMNLKWAFTNYVPKLPLDGAVRLLYSSSGVNYQQTLQGVPVTVDYSSSIYGITVDVSRSLFILEPYMGLGLARYSSTLSGKGDVSLFDQTVGVGSSFSGSATSLWFKTGFEIRLLLLTVGAQYDRVFGGNTYGFKAGFKF